MMQMPFPELPGYEVLELIGRDGAMTIWKARQLSLNRLVTVKVLTLGADVDEDSPIRFRQEAGMPPANGLPPLTACRHGFHALLPRAFGRIVSIP